MGVLAHQGFKLQRNTLQAIISSSVTAPYFDQAINTFLPYLNAEKGTEGDLEFQEYFKKFVSKHYAQMSNKLPYSRYMKDYGKEVVQDQLQELDYSYQSGQWDEVFESGDGSYQEEPGFMTSYAKNKKGLAPERPETTSARKTKTNGEDFANLRKDIECPTGSKGKGLQPEPPKGKVINPTPPAAKPKPNNPKSSKIPSKFNKNNIK